MTCATGPDGRQVLTRVYESRMDMGQYTVEYTPIIPGEGTFYIGTNLNVA